MQLKTDDKILFNYIKATKRDYLTNEEFTNFLGYLNQRLKNDNVQEKWNIFKYLNLQRFINNSYPIFKSSQNYQGIYVEDMAEFNRLLSNNPVDEYIQICINDYIKALKKITKYILYPIKDYANAFGYVDREDIYYIIVKAFILEENIKHRYLNEEEKKYHVIFSNPGVERLNAAGDLNIPFYILGMWPDEIEVDQIFDKLGDAQNVKDEKNHMLKANFINKQFPNKNIIEFNSLMDEYLKDKEKYEKLENLILQKQKNLSVANQGKQRIRTL